MSDLFSNMFNRIEHFFFLGQDILIGNKDNSATLWLQEELCAPFKMLLGSSSAVLHVKPLTVLFHFRLW